MRSYHSEFFGFTSTMAFGKRLTWLTIALMAFASVGFCYKKYRVHDELVLLVFRNRFIEPIENLYLLTYDLTLYKISSEQNRYVDFEMDGLKKSLKKRGHKISDIMIIIHNHPPTAPRNFSKADIRTWREFKSEGFTGNFYLYISGFNAIYELRENGEDKE